jgi:hypothetical protein
MADEIRAEAMSVLKATLGAVDGMLARGAEKTAEIQAGSRLASDDAATAPHQMTHAMTACLTHAVDHLEALRLWLFKAQRVPAWATFSVARGAIENAATAVWLQTSDDQATRVRRRIKLHVRDIRDGTRFRDLVDAPPPRPAEQRLDELVELGKPFGIDSSDVLGRTVGYANIVEDAGVETPDLTDTGPLALWQICSGLAHGQTWATLGVLDREIVSDDGVAYVVKLTAPELPLVGVVNIATRLTVEGFRLFDRHRLRWKDSKEVASP